MSSKLARPPKTTKTVRPSEHLARMLREARESRRWSQQDLAHAMTKAGWPIDRTTIAKIEAGGKRAANVSVDESLAFAAVLGMSPLHLIVPWDDNVMVAITPTEPASAIGVRHWFAGTHPLNMLVQHPGMTTAEVLRRPDHRFFFYMQPPPSYQLPSPEQGTSGNFAGEFGRESATRRRAPANVTRSRATRRKKR